MHLGAYKYTYTSLFYGTTAQTIFKCGLLIFNRSCWRRYWVVLVLTRWLCFPGVVDTGSKELGPKVPPNFPPSQTTVIQERCPNQRLIRMRQVNRILCCIQWAGRIIYKIAIGFIFAALAYRKYFLGKVSFRLSCCVNSCHLSTFAFVSFLFVDGHPSTPRRGLAWETANTNNSFWWNTTLPFLVIIVAVRPFSLLRILLFQCWYSEIDFCDRVNPPRERVT